jgi:type IV pilus assembly protein PilV
MRRTLDGFTQVARGSTIIEVLVALLVIAVGLLGIAGLQSRLVVAEVEAYQRSQALILLNDMASRISSNRSQAASYLISSTGTGATCVTGATNTADRDLRDWCNALQGAAEVIGGNKRGAMIGARGCIAQRSTDATIYDVSIAWQGLSPLTSPSNTCGKTTGSTNNYDSAGTPCVNDLCRRVVTIQVPLGNLAQ